MVRAKKGKGPYSTISLPTPLVNEVQRVVEALGYWPVKTDFVREAVIEKLEKHKKELEERRRIEEAQTARAQSVRNYDGL